MSIQVRRPSSIVQSAGYSVQLWIGLAVFVFPWSGCEVGIRLVQRDLRLAVADPSEVAREKRVAPVARNTPCDLNTGLLLKISFMHP